MDKWSNVTDNDWSSTLGYTIFGSHFWYAAGFLHTHINSISERHIQDALKELMKGRTTFVIAHRLSTSF
ncbi:hypothetical protein CL644_02780 [bacterium]|nr:hypothetical protein [Parcubacteria group bacterium]MBF05607.1 hypothetical protein [bacterium]